MMFSPLAPFASAADFHQLNKQLSFREEESLMQFDALKQCWLAAVIGCGVLGIGPMAVAQSSVVVPHGVTVTIDGTWEQGEWNGLTLGDSSVTLRVHEADGYVHIGVRSDPLLVASLCLARGDTVDILHASAALGRGRYVWNGTQWSLTEDFEWRLRTLDLGPEGQAARALHRSEQGWVASITPLGVAGEVEFQISAEWWRPEGVRLAMGLLAEGGNGRLLSWPTRLGADACNQREIVAGPLPDTVTFAVTEWVVLELEAGDSNR